MSATIEQLSAIYQRNPDCGGKICHLTREHAEMCAEEINRRHPPKGMEMPVRAIYCDRCGMHHTVRERVVVEHKRQRA